MIIYINSNARNQGQSTFAYSFAKMYGNMSNQPTLLISLRDDSFVRMVTRLPEHYEFASIDAMVQRATGKGNFTPSTYKLENTLYYYNAKGAALSDQVSIKSVEDLLTKAQVDFSMVVVDADISVNNFYNFVDIIDKLILTVTPNIVALKSLADSMEKMVEKYETAKSQKIPCDIYYALTKYDESLTLSEAYKELGGSSRNVFGVAYNLNLARSHNKGKLDDYITGLLIDAKTADKKYLINFRDAVKKIIGFRMPSRKVDVPDPNKNRRKGFKR